MRPSGPVTIGHRWGVIFDDTEFEFELILIQGMNSEAVMIETFIRGLLAGRQGKDSSEGRSTPFPCRKFHQKTTNLEQQFLTSCITLSDLVLQLKRIWWPMVLQTLATVATGEQPLKLLLSPMMAHPCLFYSKIFHLFNFRPGHFARDCPDAESGYILIDSLLEFS